MSRGSPENFWWAWLLCLYLAAGGAGEEPDLGHPQHLQDVYKGTWHMQESVYQFSQAKWPFVKNNGAMLFHLSTRGKALDGGSNQTRPETEPNAGEEPTLDPETEGWRAAIGFMEIRGGPYSTDTALKFRLHGES